MGQDPIWAPNSNQGHVGAPVTGSAIGGGKHAVDVATSSTPLATIIDEPNATTTYVGVAAIGSATSASSWQIKRLSVSGTVTTVSWADGNSAFDNVWDDRASLSYS